LLETPIFLRICRLCGILQNIRGNPEDGSANEAISVKNGNTPCLISAAYRIILSA
jgi:hypothetical protein